MSRSHEAHVPECCMSISDINMAELIAWKKKMKSDTYLGTCEALNIDIITRD